MIPKVSVSTLTPSSLSPGGQLPGIAVWIDLVYRAWQANKQPLGGLLALGVVKRLRIFRRYQDGWNTVYLRN